MLKAAAEHARPVYADPGMSPETRLVLAICVHRAAV
jgi:hypothetical protein